MKVYRNAGGAGRDYSRIELTGDKYAENREIYLSYFCQDGDGEGDLGLNTEQIKDLIKTLSEFIGEPVPTTTSNALIEGDL